MGDVWKNLAIGAGRVIREYSETIAPSYFEPVCESPIEVVFGSAFHLCCALHGTPLQVLRDLTGSIGDGPFIVPQFTVGRYRADFLLGVGADRGRLSRCVIVECDGHDFHEKTKEQAARDKARDRELLVSVAKVIRFTGSEMHSKPYECADEAWELMAQVYSAGS